MFPGKLFFHFTYPLRKGKIENSIDTIDYVPWIGNNATCAANPSCAVHSFSISKKVMMRSQIWGWSSIEAFSGHTNASLDYYSIAVSISYLL